MRAVIAVAGLVVLAGIALAARSDGNDLMYRLDPNHILSRLAALERDVAELKRTAS